MNDESASWRFLLQKAYGEFLEELESSWDETWNPASYETCDAVSEGRWRPFIDHMVSGDLQEAINQLNSWRTRLNFWGVWLKVLASHKGDDEWSVSDHFVEPLAHFCMFQPSSTRDRLGSIATDAIHQANLLVDPQYADRLDQDERRSGHLSRKDREKQLHRIGGNWSTFASFEKSLQSLDSVDYRSLTQNFRNLASHAIAPRFEHGYTRAVIRTVGPRSVLAKQDDGTFNQVEHPTLKAVSYGFGGTAPLPLREMYEANFREHVAATEAMKGYQILLHQIVAIA